MKSALNTAVLSSTLLMPLLASTTGVVKIRATQMYGDNHRLEIFKVDNGAKGSSRLTFQWIENEGFKLEATKPKVDNPGWGAGAGAFTYINSNGDKIDCHMEGGFSDVNQKDVGWNFKDSGDAAFGPCLEEQNGVKLICSAPQQCEKGYGAA